MPAIERVIPLVSHLPASLRDALVRRLRELMGFALIVAAGILSAALMTWSVQDPSLSHATSRAIRNIIGYPGAIGADLLMQILGLGAIMLILPIAVWGWRMMTHRAFDREALRLGCWILSHGVGGGLCQLLAAWRRLAAADRTWRRGRRRAAACAGRRVRAARFHLPLCARPHPVRRHERGLPDRLRHTARSRRTTNLLSSRTMTRRSWKTRRRIAARSRSAGFFHALMSAKARLSWFFATCLSFAGVERPAAAQAVVRTPGAQSRRPRRAVDRA